MNYDSVCFFGATILFSMMRDWSLMTLELGVFAILKPLKGFSL